MKTNTHSPLSADEQQDAVIRPIPSGGQAACRAVRILQILQERTDAATLMSFEDIAAELKQPSDELLPPIPTDRRALSTAVGVLRAVGFDIVNVPRVGYAALQHPLTDEEATILGRLIVHSTDINARQRESLLASICRLCSPTARHEIEMALLRHPSFAGQQPVSEYRLTHTEPRVLIETAIAERLPFSFEIDELVAHGGQAGTTSHPPQALYPTVVTDRYGAAFVTGKVVDAHDGEIRMRTIMISRLNNLTLRLRDGSLLLASIRDDDTESLRDAGSAPFVV